MGKDWLYWISGGRSSARRRRIAGEKEAAVATTTSAGCMCAVFQLFDFHHPFQFPLNQHNSSPGDINPFFQEEATPISRGVEAPRNSLELEEPSAMKAASSSSMKEDENLNFPVGIQIKKSHVNISSPRVSTTTSKSRVDDISSECSSSNSPGTKTPNLVARLMGLDLLPECTSPSISSSSPKPKLKSHHQQRKDRTILQSRSSRSFFDDDISVGLPETPRISSARRSDVDYNRLSLQINKESSKDEEMGRRRGRLSQNENIVSPGNYARQIVKDSVSRRVVGRDITNTDRNRSSDHQYIPRRDENLVLLKPTKTTPKDSSFTTSSCSRNGKNRSPRASLSSDNNHRQPNQTEEFVPLQEYQKDSKSNNAASSSSSTKVRKLLPPQANCDKALRNKKEEMFVRSNKQSLAAENKSKKSTPLSSDDILHVKKGPSPPPTKLPQKQSHQVSSDALSSKMSTQLSRTPRHNSYKYQLHLHQDKKKITTAPHPAVPDTSHGCATPPHGGASSEYLPYIQRILQHASPQWHIDPSVFRHLEPFTTTISAAVSGRNTALSHRSNRKLVFQLVDELLGEMLTPHFSLRPLTSSKDEDGSFCTLVDQLCKKIDSFPAANCVVLEDIDSLIDKDLRKCGVNGEEDEMSIVNEVEGEIVEWLVRETVAVMSGCAAAEGQTAADGFHVGA